MSKDWTFDQAVAKTFVRHAQQHIPNYDTVINKTVDACKYLLSSEASIIDVGCATGNTLNHLRQQGFTNLTGIDSSQSMLDQCQVSNRLICGTQFPNEKFDAVLCNWTLHFIKEKTDYLQQIYAGLNDQGFLILSEKTSLDPLPIHFYHLHKSRLGVSDADIKHKQQSIQNIMFIDQPNWYLKTLSQVGFSKVYIIDAHWCFTTFLCLK